MSNSDTADYHFIAILTSVISDGHDTAVSNSNTAENQKHLFQP